MTSAPAIVGERLHLLAEAVTVVDRVIRPHATHDGELVFGGCSSDDPRAQQLADVDGGKPDAAAGAMHQQCLADRETCPLQGVECGRIIASKRRCLFQVGALWNGRHAVRGHNNLLDAAAPR